MLPALVVIGNATVTVAPLSRLKSTLSRSRNIWSMLELLQLAQIEDRTAIGVAIRDLLDLLIAAQHLRRHA